MVIISKLAGGIGNQLFQYSFGKSLAIKFNAEFKVDISSYANYAYHHDFELKKLFPNLKIVDSKIFEGASGNYFLNEGNIRSLDDFNNLPSDCESIIVSGYWQSEKFISANLLSELNQLFHEKIKDQAGEISSELCSHPSLTSVHIRRRDYAHMGICLEEYYVAAVKSITEATPDTLVLLFSDEPNYSRHFLNAYYPNKIRLVNTGFDLVDLYLMSICQYSIISNSTFSWWGAYLNENRKKLIIRPSPWLTIDDSDPCPARWIKVHNSVEARSIDSNKIANLTNSISTDIRTRICTTNS